MRWVNLTAPLAVSLLAGCMFGPDLCSYETRRLRLGGVLIAEGYSQAADGSVSLRETREGGTMGRRLVISAETYYPAYLGVLLDSAAGGADTVVAVPVAPHVGQHRLGDVFLDRFEEPSLQHLHDAAEAGRLVLEMHARSAPWPPLAGKLSVIESSEWYRPTCTGT